MERIVVGVDGSVPSSKALKLAAELGVGLGAHLTLVHVKRPVLVSPEGYQELIEDMRAQAEREANAVLEEAVRTAESLGASTEIRSLEGPPAETLVDIAEAERAVLLVVGSRGHGAVARVMLGSVADRAVHISKVPVLVAR